MINGNGTVFYQSNGRLHELPNVKLDQKILEHAAKRIARVLGKDISEAKPLLDARLADGSRVSIVYSPISHGGISFTIRKFRANWFTLGQLVSNEALPTHVADLLAQAVIDRQTILIVGATDTGKSTFAKSLIDFIPIEERLGVIEDTIELKIDHRNAFRFEAREETRGPEGEITVPAVTIRDLVKASLRNRPDRLIIGEVRGAEAFDMLDALNTGHAGVLPCSIFALRGNMFMTDASFDQIGEGSAAECGSPSAATQCRVARSSTALVTTVQPVRASSIPVFGGSGAARSAGRSHRGFGADYAQGSAEHGAPASERMREAVVSPSERS